MFRTKWGTKKLNEELIYLHVWSAEDRTCTNCHVDTLKFDENDEGTG